MHTDRIRLSHLQLQHPQAGQDRMAILGGIPPKSVVSVWNLGGKTQAWYLIRHFSEHMFTDSTYFPPIFPLVLSCRETQ